MAGQASDLSGLRVFVSYPRGGLGHTWAERVHEHLETLGGDVWRDEREVREGDDDWSRAIRDGLRSSDVVACVVSQCSELCTWQTNEVLDARTHKIPVVLFRVDAAAEVPWMLNQHQPVELRQDEAASLRLLTERLAEHQRARPQGTEGVQRHAARQREQTYLGNLLHRKLHDVEDLYIPVEGRQRRHTTLERSRRMRVFRGDSTLRMRASGGEKRPEEQVFPDVLDAYRALDGRSKRRLAVLGEPGAGKTYSLERIACDYARQALADPAAPIPLYVDLGGWTRAGQSLESYIDWRLETVFKGLRRDFIPLRESERAVLLLDGMNEIPPGQRAAKLLQVREEAQDPRHASVLVSCRKRDFDADCKLPFNEVHLQSLTPSQVHDAILRTMVRDEGEAVGRAAAGTLFWRIAGEGLRELWTCWEQAGLPWLAFWALETPSLLPDSVRWRDEWRQAQLGNPRSLLKLVSNPYLLTLLMDIHVEDGQIPANRAELFKECLASLYKREYTARNARHDRTPPFEVWHAALVAVAEVLQRVDGSASDDGARTTLARAERPAEMTDELVAFSRDASVLEQVGDDLRFTHQLLQESLAADVLLYASRTGQRPASDFWPKDRWWQRSGWEVVAEIAAEACDGDTAAQVALIDWLAADHPGMALDIWKHAERPALPAELLTRTAAQWCPRLTDIQTEPAPEARAVIGRWLGALDLDHRPGTGLRPDGLPDIDWVRVDDERTLFDIGRYPVTNRQWQAFIDDGGYRNDRWWAGLAERMEPRAPQWSEPTAPRETVSWYEAMAYCRWLSVKSGQSVALLSEAQWVRAARGSSGLDFAWGSEWDSDPVNANFRLKHTSLVGLCPNGATPEGVQDMVGNVWVWCLDEHSVSPTGKTWRIVRGGAWSDITQDNGLCWQKCHVSDYCNYDLGLRLVRAVPHSGHGSLDHRASDATPSR